ncbi:MAG TPA: LacI family DNA-binding transcriptional regulator [Dongiaceae bacterium]|nr:LacI family DNA-binding transcriptional regulator [Dongiaceae bacterium]
MASIGDVARLAGVSLGTASRVMNGNPAVTPQLRDRVLAAAAELDYQPNVLARALRSSRTHSIGLILPDVTNPFFGELAKHVEQVAAGINYTVMLANSNDNPKAEADYIKALTGRQVDGLLIVPCEETKTLPRDIKVPIVLVDRPLRGYSVVQCDHRGGAIAAVQHLVSLGHRRIGCIAGPRHLNVARERYEGYRTVAAPIYEQDGLDLAADTVTARFDYDCGYEAALKLLARADRPTAIFASSDQQAIGALRAAADLDLKVPGDVSIVGFDAISLAKLVTPRLTTVAQPIAAIADIAVRTVLRAREPDSRVERHRLPTLLQPANSSGPMRGRDQLAGAADNVVALPDRGKTPA